jgi:hypothetical protein
MNWFYALIVVVLTVAVHDVAVYDTAAMSPNHEHEAKIEQQESPDGHADQHAEHHGAQDSSESMPAEHSHDADCDSCSICSVHTETGTGFLGFRDSRPEYSRVHSIAIDHCGSLAPDRRGRTGFEIVQFEFPGIDRSFTGAYRL